MMLSELQGEHKFWADKNFPNTIDPGDVLLGITEELGELCHAELKSKQKIRGTTRQHHIDKIDAIGDMVIYMTHYCNLVGIDFESAVEDTWKKVQERNWLKNNLDGRTSRSS